MAMDDPGKTVPDHTISKDKDTELSKHLKHMTEASRWSRMQQFYPAAVQ